MPVALGSPYSPLKIFFHPDKLADLRADRQPVPLQVQVIMSDLCNQNCSFCAYRNEGYTSNVLFHVHESDGTVNNNPARFLSYTKILELLDDFVAMGVRAVQYTGGGEPTVHPRHADVFRETLQRGLDLALVTNGVRLSSEVIALLADAKWVRVSLDAGTETTYAQMRQTPPAFFQKVLTNIAALASVKPPGAELVIGVGFVVTKENWREVVVAAQLARDHGADNFRISAVFQQDNFDYFRPFYQDAVALTQEAVALSTPRFTVSNLFGERLDDLTLTHPDYSFCGYQHLQAYIGADQNLYRCCNLAYNPRGLVGSLKDQRFRALWTSAEKHADYAQFDAHECPRCQFNNKNRTIAQALQVPQHLNFI